MRAHRTLAAAGIVAGILANSSMASGSVAAPFTAHPTKPTVSVTASGGVTHASEVAAAQFTPGQVGICGTAFGPPVNDGILSWNNTLKRGINVAGAADFYCPSSVSISTVDVMGYYGAPAGTATFNVTVYADSPGEPDNAVAVCAKQSAIGSPTGSVFPNAQQTTIPLTTPCNVTAGRYWLEVQEVDATDPWYWETQAPTGVNYDGDWRDTNNSLGFGCNPGYVDHQYMQDCIFGGDVGERDYLFFLSGDALPDCGSVDQITPLSDARNGAQSMNGGAKGQAADDFVCQGTPPSSPFGVSTVAWKGRYTGCTSGVDCGPATSFTITIYTDDPNGGTNEPGTVVCSRSVRYAAGYGPPPAPGTFQESGQPTYNGVKDFQATLSTPCNLTSGTTYWLSVTASLAVSAVWKWELGSAGGSGVVGPSPADWRKRAVPACSAWDNSTYLYQPSCLNVPKSKNLFFRIN